MGDDLLLADQEPENENDDDINNDDVNVESNQEEEENSSDEEEVQINFIEEDKDEQPQQLQEQPQLLQDAIREQQQIQSLENQLAAERVLLRMNPDNEDIRNRILELQQQINNLRRGNAQSGG